MNILLRARSITAGITLGSSSCIDCIGSWAGCSSGSADTRDSGIMNYLIKTRVLVPSHLRIKTNTHSRKVPIRQPIKGEYLRAYFEFNWKCQLVLLLFQLIQTRVGCFDLLHNYLTCKTIDFATIRA